jgi:probable H4MPT-linked C1 transfer pathway protein
MERLMSGELVYTGVLRTNLAAIVQSVPVSGRTCRVSSEYFAVSGDVHLILGHIGPQDYTSTTPDGRPPTVESARSRLARLVCADAEALDQTEIEALARHIYRQQVLQVRSGLEQVLSSDPELRPHPALVCGAGAFLGRAAARGLGLEIRPDGDDLGSGKSAVLPCFAAASLLDAHLKGSF